MKHYVILRLQHNDSIHACIAKSGEFIRLSLVRAGAWPGDSDLMELIPPCQAFHLQDTVLSSVWIFLAKWLSDNAKYTNEKSIGQSLKHSQGSGRAQEGLRKHGVWRLPLSALWEKSWVFPESMELLQPTGGASTIWTPPTPTENRRHSRTRPMFLCPQVERATKLHEKGSFQLR